MILDAWGWCTGTTQRDGIGREEGGGFRMGNTCIPVVDSKEKKKKRQPGIFINNRAICILDIYSKTP